MRNYTSRFATKNYVDEQIATLDRNLRTYINNLIDSLRTQISNDLQEQIQNLTENTLPNLINSALSALETRLQTYARNQDASLRNALMQEIADNDSRCIKRRNNSDQ